jgi:hypothetical protein
MQDVMKLPSTASDTVDITSLGGRLSNRRRSSRKVHQHLGALEDVCDPAIEIKLVNCYNAAGPARNQY